MTEIPKRFTKEEVYRTEIGRGGHSDQLWVDVPELLDHEHILTQWSLGNSDIVSQRLNDIIDKTSRAIASTSSDADISEPSYDSNIFDSTKKLEEILKTFEENQMLAHLIEPLKNILKESREYDVIKFTKRAHELGRVANGRTELYVGGLELWTSNDQNVPTPGFAGRFKGMVTIQQSKNLTMEPIVEGKDGSLGLFPKGVFFGGLYRIRQLATYDKKWRMDNRYKMTPQEEAQYEIDLEAYYLKHPDERIS